MTVRLGTPISAFGQDSRNRAARQRIPHRAHTDSDGVEHHHVRSAGLFQGSGLSGNRCSACTARAPRAHGNDPSWHAVVPCPGVRGAWLTPVCCPATDPVPCQGAQQLGSRPVQHVPGQREAVAVRPAVPGLWGTRAAADFLGGPAAPMRVGAGSRRRFLRTAPAAEGQGRALSRDLR